MPSQNSSGSMVSTSPVLARAMTSSPQDAGLRLSSATAGPCRQVSRPAMSLRKSWRTVGAAGTAWRTVLSSSTTRRVSSISPRLLHSTRPAIATPVCTLPHPEAGTLEKRGDDLLEQNILVQEDRAFGDFPPGHGV